MRQFLLFISMILLCASLKAQTINKTDYTYDINQKIGNTDYYYYFNKGKNDTFINLKIMTFKDESQTISFKKGVLPSNTLCNEVLPLVDFYNTASKEIKLDLWNMNIGYPMQYADVLANQINFFVKDTSWQKYYTSYKSNLKKEFVNLDYELISKKMKEGNVYTCLEIELNKIGYTIQKIGIEKVGFLDVKFFPSLKKELLQTYPYTEAQLKTVPIPYMVYIGINKLK